LINNFIGNYLIQTERMRNSPNMFGNQKFLFSPQRSQHEWVLEHYERTSKVYLNNTKRDDLSGIIIPMCHGTELSIAEKICETGFAALSSVDAGYFGRGIYFTSFSMYCVPYIAGSKFPSIVVSYLLPGNVYPVIEEVDGPDTLLGSAIKSGYNSHFIVTDKKGVCVPNSDNHDEGELFNELVVPQESQIVPAFIFELEGSDMEKLSGEWNREVPKGIRYSKKLLLNPNKMDSKISLDDDYALTSPFEF